MINKDNQYTLFSTDNKSYDNPVLLENYSRNDFVCAYNISIDSHVSNYIVTVIGRAYGNVENCAVLKENRLVVLIDDFIVFINLITHQIELSKKLFDFGTGIELYTFNDGYIVNAEVDLLYLDRYANLIWTFCGRDIWVRPTNESSIKIIDNTLLLTDFAGYQYCLDKSGNEIL